MNIPFLDTIAAKVAGAVAVATMAALAVVMWRADAISADRDRYRDRLAGEEARHAITRQSVATLETSLARFVGDGKARRVAQLAAIERQRGYSSTMHSLAQEIRAEIAAFEPGEDCRTPDFVMEGRR